MNFAKIAKPFKPKRWGNNIRSQILVNSLNRLGLGWPKYQIKYFVTKTKHEYTVSDTDNFYHTVSIYRKQDKKLIYRNNFHGHFVSAVFAAYANLIKMSEQSKMLDYDYGDAVLPKLSGLINYIGGSVYRIAADIDLVKGIGRQDEPEQDVNYSAIYNKHVPAHVQELVRGYINSMSAKQTVGTYAPLMQGSPKLPSLIREYDPDNEDDIDAFMDSTEGAHSFSVVGTFINYAFEGEDPGVFKPIGLEVMPFDTPEMHNMIFKTESAPGGAGYASNCPTAGSVVGSKNEQAFVSKRVLQDLISEMVRRLSMIYAANCYQVDYEQLISQMFDLFSDPYFDGFVWQWVKTFEKAEVIAINKFTRMIWACSLISVLLDKILYKRTQHAHKLWHSHGWTHGFAAAGGGLHYLLSEAVSFLSKRMRCMPMRFVNKLASKFKVVREEQDTDYDLIRKLVQVSLAASDDDVKNWDLGIKCINFCFFDIAVLIAHGVSPFKKNPPMRDVIFTALVMISNSWASTKYVRIKQFDDGDSFIAAVVNSLPSGMYNTAHEGSYLHQQFRIERCTAMSRMLFEIKKDVSDRPNAYPDPTHMMDLIDYTLLGQCEYHHSDDFQSYISLPSIPILALYDNTRHYADYHALKLKADLNAARPGTQYGGCPINLDKLIHPDISRKYKVDYGTPEGIEYNNHYTFDTVLLYDYPTRLKLQFKSPYTVFEHSEEYPCGRVVEAGAEFLRQYLKRPLPDEQFGYTWCIPVREVGRFMAKLKYFPQKTLDPFEVLLKLISCGYGCAGNRELHRVVSIIFKEYKEFHQLTEDQIMVGIQSVPDKKSYKHKLGNLSLLEKSTFPDYKVVCQFVSAGSGIKRKYRNQIIRFDRGDYHGWAPLARVPIPLNLGSNENYLQLQLKANNQLARLRALALANGGKMNHIIARKDLD